MRARGYRKISAGGLDERDVGYRSHSTAKLREGADGQILRESRFYVNPWTRVQRATEAQESSVQPPRS